MYKKVLIGSLGLISASYYYAQRVDKIDLGLYQTAHSLLWKCSPRYAVTMLKVLASSDLLWIKELVDKSKLGDLEIKNPLGLASGFDADGGSLVGLSQLGFGFIEVGSVTCQSNINADTNTYNGSYENELPQRLLQAKAQIHNFKQKNPNYIVGVTIMGSEDIYSYAPYLVDKDIENAYRELYPVADYIAINLTSSKRVSAKYKELFIPQVWQAIKQMKDTEMEEVGLSAAIGEGPSIIGDHLNALPLKKHRTQLYLKVNDTQQFQLQNIQGVILVKNELSEQDYLSKIKQLRQQNPDLVIISNGGIKTKQQYIARINAGSNACQILNEFLKSGPKVIEQLIL